MTPYYSDGSVTIYHGDCREILPDVRADLVVTSPPYNRGARIDGNWQGITTATCKSSRFRGGYGTNTDSLPWDEYRSWLRETLAVVWESVSEQGAMFLNHKPRIVNGELWTPLEALAGLPLRQIVVWETGPGVNFTPGAFVPAHEWIMLVARPSFGLTDGTNAQGDVWRIPYDQNGADHPATFPLSLARRCVSATASAVILDPFAGSGTTLRAAKDLGRKAIGIEIEERYCEIAAKRCAQEVLDFGSVA